MKYLLYVIFLLITLPAWASGDYFASDRQAIIDGLTAKPQVSYRSLSPSKKIRAIRVCPEGGGTETIEIDVADQAPRVQMRIQFDTNSDVLRKSSLPLLQELGAALHDPLLRDKPVRIAGHTDGDGGDEYNLDLSLRRAARVAAWLTEHANVDARSLEIVGCGERVPLVKNTSAANKQKNRRVEISVQEGGFQKDMPGLGTKAPRSSEGMAW